MRMVAWCDSIGHDTRAEEATMIASVQSDDFDYQATAELFPGKNIRGRSRVVKYMRFDYAADAIRFAIEQLSADVFLGACLEVNEKRYDSRAIRRLYDCVEYPFNRLAKVA
jgi:hypothetical protein